MTAPLLTCTDLHLRRGDFTLHIPAWQVPSGSVVGLVGPVGAGKSTLLEALVGLRPVEAGSLSVCGLDPTRVGAQVRARAALMSDDMPVFPGRIDRVLRRVSRYYPTWDAERAESLRERFEQVFDRIERHRCLADQCPGVLGKALFAQSRDKQACSVKRLQQIMACRCQEPGLG